MELFAYFCLELLVHVLFIVNLVLPMGEGTLIPEFAGSSGGEVLTELSLVLHLVALYEILAFLLTSELSFRRFRRVIGGC